jgi:hypothetical protein
MHIFKGLALACGVAVVSTPAWADVSIGVQEAGVNGGAITTEASSANNAAVGGLDYGTFNLNDLDADEGISPVLLNGVALDQVSTDGLGGTLKVYMTYTDITTPLGNLDFRSGLTSNLLPAGWSVLEQTFVNPSNTLYGTETALASQFFSANGTSIQDDFHTLSGPYSVTEVFTINAAAGGGSALDTIRMGAAAVPEPAAWAMMLLGVFAVGAVLRGTRYQRAVLTV